MKLDDIFSQIAQNEKELSSARAELRRYFNCSFKDRPEIADLATPKGLTDLINFATHPFYSSASFSAGYNALNGIWRVELGSKVIAESGGPDFSMALAAGLLKYYDKEIPESVFKFVEFKKGSK